MDASDQDGIPYMKHLIQEYGNFDSDDFLGYPKRLHGLKELYSHDIGHKSPLDDKPYISSDPMMQQIREFFSAMHYYDFWVFGLDGS
ncbi:MAG: hypothetical protein BroJett041_04160 [Candidatus Jettenia caeni]|nr:MAG: hypothetical protein BroJett041_04160 [Candidatus Jettenia caeni]GJQ45721.1 MAG: hypothetical protein JETCAE04_14750 [Candidatus Jettenia caeni]